MGNKGGALQGEFNFRSLMVKEEGGRHAERQLSASLFQELPRTTRLESVAARQLPILLSGLSGVYG
jgi:hypothetical protein